MLEYLDGETLTDRLQKGALQLDSALNDAVEIADAIDKAHRLGITHRDLKPGNIMLTKSGAKILDFGLAKLGSVAPIGIAGMTTAATRSEPLTGQGTILGTVQYMAPEQLEGKDADARTDIFACGVTIYEMVTGRKAFDEKSGASLIGAILKDNPPPMVASQPLVSAALDRAVKTCLAKDPDDRWQSASDLSRELKWIAEGAADGTAAAIVPSTRFRERAVWVVGAVAVLAIAALAALATLYSRRAVPEPVVTRLDVVTPPTSEGFSFALSPDGRQLAFVANGENGSQLWLRPFDQGKAQPLAGTLGASFPFWAPDGDAVGFFADAKLKRIDLTSGALKVLADAPFPRGGAWNPDDVVVFAPTTNDALLRVPATGGTPAAVTRLAAGQNSHRWPQFLPDGRRFLFLNATGQPDTRGIYVGSLNGGEPTRVMPAETAAAYAAPGYLLLVSQGVLTVYPFDAASAIVAGRRRQWRSRLGRTTERSEAPSRCRHKASWRIALELALGDSSSGPTAPAECWATSAPLTRVVTTVSSWRPMVYAWRSAAIFRETSTYGSSTWAGGCQIASRLMLRPIAAHSGHRKGEAWSFDPRATAPTTCSRSPRAACLTSNR